MAISKGVILVGGPSRGTRFRPLSLDTPKPLFPLGGYPIIHHHVKALSQVSDLKEILLIGFFEESVFQPFLNEAKRDFPNINVRYLREYQALGTAGGLYHFRDQITSQNPDGFFVLHADVMSSFPLEELKQFHVSKNSVGTVMGTQVAKELATNFGCLVADEKTQEVLHYVEKPESFVSNLISTGIYYFSCNIFDYIKKARDGTLSNQTPDLEYVITTTDDKLRLEQDLLQPMAGSQTIYVFETAEPWVQITTASSALPANQLCLKQLAKSNPELMAKTQEGGYEVSGEVFVHPTATIDPSAKIGPNVFIGANVTVGKGSRVRDSLILDNTQIKDNSCVIHSIIGWDGRVGSWCRIEGSAPTNGSYDNVTKHGIKIQSTTVLGRDVSIRDETIIRNCMVLPHKELKDNFHNEILM